MKIQLRDYQQKIVNTIPNKHCLWLEMRVGKTPTAIKLVDTRAKSGLVISPKSVVSHWENEIKLWSDDPGKFKVVSRDWFSRHWGKLNEYEAIIVDEVHRGFGNFKSQMHKSLQRYKSIYSPKYLWLLSGTPYTSTSWSIYSYGKLIGKDWNWYKWDRYFFDRIRMGRRAIPVAKKGVEKYLQKILRTLGVVLALEDITEVPEDVNIIEEFSLTAEQKKGIKNIDEDLPVTRYIKQHQFEQGSVKSDGYSEEIIITTNKDKRLKELVEDNKKIIIICRYLLQIEKYKKMFADKKLYVISGQEKREASLVASFANKANEAVVLIQSDTSDGYDLSGFNIMVFASMSYSFVNYEQIRARMKKVGKKENCAYIHLLTEGKSLDQAIYKNVSHKRDFSFEMYAKKRI